jgi:hypothetical protein
MSGSRQLGEQTALLRAPSHPLRCIAPTAAISVRQVAEVLELIRRLKSRGVSVMLISHRMPDVFTVCDRGGRAWAMGSAAVGCKAERPSGAAPAATPPSVGLSERAAVRLCVPRLFGGFLWASRLGC